jgi:phosphopentomutase
MDEAVKLLETFDSVLAGLLEVMGSGPHLILLTSDHGNIEDIQRRGHTLNPVPALLIGPANIRDRFADGLKDLSSFADAIMETIISAEEHT